MDKQEVVVKIHELLNKRNLNNLIEVTVERLNDYKEHCSQHEEGNKECIDPDDTCYREGFENDLSEVVVLLKELNELKEAL